jgi:hypothetical protein
MRFAGGHPGLLDDALGANLAPQSLVIARWFDSVGTIDVGRLIGQIHIVASGSNHCYSLSPITHLLGSA